MLRSNPHQGKLILCLGRQRTDSSLIVCVPECDDYLPSSVSEIHYTYSSCFHFCQVYFFIFIFSLTFVSFFFVILLINKIFTFLRLLFQIFFLFNAYILFKFKFTSFFAFKECIYFILTFNSLIFRFYFLLCTSFSR